MSGKLVLGVLAAFGAGASIATQSSINGALAKPSGSPFAATAISFASGTVLLFFASLFKFGQEKAPIVDKPVYKWMWIAPGCMGAYLVTLGTWLGPLLGFSLFSVCIVFGQLAASLVIDHIGVLDMERSPVTFEKVAGITTVLIGSVVSVMERFQVSVGSPLLTLIYVCLVILAGVLTSLSVPVNNAFTVRYGTLPHRTSLMVFSVGTLVVCAIWAIAYGASEQVRVFHFQDSEPWMYLGGMLGAYFVVVTVALAQLLGVSLMFISIVAGQLLLSVFIDHFGWFNAQVSEASLLRLVGVGLVFVGAAIFQLPSGTLWCKSKRVQNDKESATIANLEL